jgi:hypothetical protein
MVHEEANRNTRATRGLGCARRREVSSFSRLGGWGGVYYCDVCELNICIKVEFYSQKKGIYLSHTTANAVVALERRYFLFPILFLCVSLSRVGPVVLYRLSRYIAYQCYSDG